MKTKFKLGLKTRIARTEKLVFQTHRLSLCNVQAHSVAASQVEKTLSEVASSLSTGVMKHGVQDSAYAQIR